MSGWGTTPWGGGGWGLSATGVRALRAVPIDRRSVRVYFDADLRALSDVGVGDALNAALWTLADTTAGVGFTVIEVVAYDGARVFDVHTLEPFGAYPNVHRLTFETVRDAGGTRLASPRRVDFRGLGLAPFGVRGTPHDLRNRPVVASEDLHGGLVVSSAHDYEGETGAAVLQKIILRRLVSDPDSYFHLADAGFGEGLRLKEPPRSLTAMKAGLERQMRRDPAVRSARVRLALDPTGVLTIQIAVEPHQGTGFEVNLEART